MKQGPLTENELEWLDNVLMEYGNDDAVLDVAELDGLLTAILSGPNMIQPGRWLSSVWGGAKNAPRWASESELTRFMDLTFQHMNDIADRLCYYPDQFAPLFGTRTVDGTEYTIVEEWCFGYMRGVALDNWSTLPKNLQPSLDAIALHGREDNFLLLEKMSSAAVESSIEEIQPAALSLHAYWLSQRLPVPVTPISMPFVATATVGRNDLCPCGSGKKFKHCCLH